MKLKQNLSINEDSLVMTMFSKYSHCDIDLVPKMLILNLVQDIVMVNSCVKLNENRSINVCVSDKMMIFVF